MTDTKIQWHPGFTAAMNLEFAKNREDLTFTKEYSLNTKPLEIDLLVIKKNTTAKIVNEIGAFFKGHNIIEYKSPGDGLNIDTFYKVNGYASLYKAYGETVDAIRADDITISLIREKKPDELFHYFKEHGYEVSCPHRGIYYIRTGVVFPTQIIVSKELDKSAHIWLISLSENLGKEDMQELLEHVGRLTEEFDKEMADSVLKVSIAANRRLLGEIMEDENMYEALMEIMEPQIQIREKESWKEGQKEGLKEGLKEGMITGQKAGLRMTALRMLGAGKYTLEEISDISGLSLDEVKKLKSENLLQNHP